MSLSPFDSFQSRFVTYLLNFPRTNEYGNQWTQHYVIQYNVVFTDCNILLNVILFNDATLKLTKRRKRWHEGYE